MTDVDIARMLGRLEKAVDEGAKENARQFHEIRQKQADQDKENAKQFGELRQKQADQAKSLQRIADEQNALEKRLQRAEGTASTAMRQSQESLHELEQVHQATVRHISKLEQSFDDGKLEIDKRLDAQDGVLDHQNKLLLAINTSIVSASSQQAKSSESQEKRFDKRLAIGAGIVVALVPVLNKIIDVLFAN